MKKIKILVYFLFIGSIILLNFDHDEFLTFTFSNKSIEPNLNLNLGIQSKNIKNSNIGDIYHKNENRKIGIYPEKITIADTGSWWGLDPYNSFYGWLLPLVFDYLVEIDDKTGSIIPGLAYQWTVTNDSKEWTFYLRNDVEFHDETKFNATSVKFSLDRLFDPNHQFYEDSWIAADTNIPLDHSEIINEFTIKLIMTESYAPLERKLAIIPIMSPTSYQESVLVHPIGTGPYMIDSNYTIGTYNFIRFPDYFKGLAPIKNIYYSSYSNNLEEYLDAIKSNQIDLIPSNDFTRRRLGKDILDEVNTSYWNVYFEYDNSRHDFVWINHLHPILEDKNVRKAINLAIDKEAYVENIREGLALPKKNILPTNVSFFNDSIEGFPYNITEAKNLLNEAGYTIGENGYRFTLNVTTWNNNQIDRGIFICSSLELIEIKCNFDIDNGGDRLIGRDFEMYVLGYQHIPDPSLLYDLLHSNGIINFGNYSNFVIDQLTYLGRETPIRQEQEFYYNLLQWKVQEEVPYILLADIPRIYLRSQNVKDLILEGFTGVKLSQTAFDNNVIIPYEENSALNSIMIHKINNLKSLNENYQIIRNVEISGQSLYFPFTDSVFSTDSKLMVTVETTHQLNQLLSTQQGTGKYYSITVNESTSNYSFRIYYDLNEFESKNLNDLAVLKWINKTESWLEIPITRFNTSLRFMEVELNGNVLIQINSIMKVTTPNNVYITGSIIVILMGLAIMTLRHIITNIRFYRWMKIINGIKKV